jgi:Rod binding domain-containing protein
MQVGGLLNNPDTQRAAASQPRLVHAAHEFEGQMLKELLKPLAVGDGLTGEDSDNSILGEFASEALGKALSEQGGFGIANRIVNQLDQSGNHSKTTAVTSNPHFNTGISLHKSLQ